jgi:hypothetical protein
LLNLVEAIEFLAGVTRKGIPAPELGVEVGKVAVGTADIEPAVTRRPGIAFLNAASPRIPRLEVVKAGVNFL